MDTRRRIFASIVLTAASFLAAPYPAAGAPRTIAPGTYVSIVIPSPEVEILLDLRTETTGFLSPYALFPPNDLGAITLAATDARGNEIDVRGSKPLSAGLYHLKVGAERGSRTPFNFQIRLLGLSDDYEPNDRAEEARNIRIPFAGEIALRSREDEDWFRFDVPGPGIVLVRLAAAPGIARARLSVQAGRENSDENPDEAPWTDVASDEAGVARRYFEAAKAGTWLVRTVSGDLPATGDEANYRLDVSFYPDKGPQGPALVLLGVSDEDAGIQQLRLRMRAQGRNVLVTNDPIEIAAALLAAAAEQADAPSSLWSRILRAVAALAFAAAVGGGIYWWRRTRRAPPGV